MFALAGRLAGLVCVLVYRFHIFYQDMTNRGQKLFSVITIFGYFIPPITVVSVNIFSSYKAVEI